MPFTRFSLPSHSLRASALLLCGALGIGPAPLVAQRPGAGKAPAKPVAKPAPAGPKFQLQLSATDSTRRTIMVLSDGDGDMLAGVVNGPPRSVLRMPVASARTVWGKGRELVQRSIESSCAVDPVKGPPAPFVHRQVRDGVTRIFAMQCALQGVEGELVFQFADSVVEGAAGVPPDLIAPFTASCPTVTTFFDGLLANLPPADSTEKFEPLGNCPKVYTASDIESLSKQLLVGNGDSVATVLIGIGPRALNSVMPKIADVDPAVRARVSRVIDANVQRPLGELADPNQMITPLAQRWRDEPDRGVADTIGRAIGALVLRNPGRIRSTDTLMSVLKTRLPLLAARAKDVPASDVAKSAALQPIQRALEVAVALKEVSGELVTPIATMAGKYSPAVDVLVARAVRTLATLGSGAGGQMKGLLISPLPLTPGPRTVGNYPEAQVVAIEAAQALAATGAAGRQDLDSLWRAHAVAPAADSAEIAFVADSMVALIADSVIARAVFDSTAAKVAADSAKAGTAMPELAPAARLLRFRRRMATRAATSTPVAPTSATTPAPTAAATVATAIAADSMAKADSLIQGLRSRLDTAAVRAAVTKRVVNATWSTPIARGQLLESEIRRRALVAGFGIACMGDSTVVEALGKVADEKLTLRVAAPAEDPSASNVFNWLVGERERTRVAALDALGGCGTRSASQLSVVARLANATEESDVPESVKKAAKAIFSKIRKIE